MIHEIAPKQYLVAYKNEAPRAFDTMLFVLRGKILLRGEEPLSFPTVGEFEDAGILDTESIEKMPYLFAIDEQRFFGVIYRPLTAQQQEKAEEKAKKAGLHFVSTRAARGLGPKPEAFSMLLAGQISGWYQRSRYCGTCGAKTVHDEKERMMRCPSCGNMIFPQICPGVIIAILHEGKLLVTRYNPEHKMFDGTGKTYNPVVHDSLVAGYIEIGETAEEAVRREVKEEVGLNVKNIRFYKTAPWPMSSSLLLSYVCEVDGSADVKLERDELSRALFLRPEEIEPDEKEAFSLTRQMMEDFRCGKLQ